MTDIEVVQLVSLAVLGIVILWALVRSIVLVPQGRAYIVERLGRYKTTIHPGLHILLPFVDKVRSSIALWEQIVSFPPQSVTTSDNLVVEIDMIVSFQVVDPRAAFYEIENYIVGVEQLTITALRDVIADVDRDGALASGDKISDRLRELLDDGAGMWGIRVNRAEIKRIAAAEKVK